MPVITDVKAERARDVYARCSLYLGRSSIRSHTRATDRERDVLTQDILAYPAVRVSLDDLHDPP